MTGGLKLEAVSHAFGERLVLDAVSLEVAAGEIVCLLGPSGSGKSTTLRLAAGLEELQQGRVLVGGQVVAGEGPTVGPEKRNVGLMFQDYALFPHLTVLGNVAFGLRGGDGQGENAALDMLRQVGMDDFAEAYPHTLSGGEQQRVALARALAPHPEVMLMDEPFSGLDVRLRDRVRDQTLALLEKLQAAALLVTHDPEEAMGMGDRIVLLREGRVVQDGPPEQLFHSPADAFTARFFSEVNEFRGVVKAGGVITPLGTVPAPDLADGTEAEVLIRLNCVRVLGQGSGGIPARVERARLIGPDARVELSVPGSDLAIRARQAGGSLPGSGTEVMLELDSSGVFVFPAASS